MPVDQGQVPQDVVEILRERHHANDSLNQARRALRAAAFHLLAEIAEPPRAEPVACGQCVDANGKGTPAVVYVTIHPVVEVHGETTINGAHAVTVPLCDACLRAARSRGEQHVCTIVPIES